MTRRIIILAVLSLYAGFLYAGESGLSAILPKGCFEAGVFQPLRYGLNETVELSTHVITNIVMPNIAAKKRGAYMILTL